MFSPSPNSSLIPGISTITLSILAIVNALLENVTVDANGIIDFKDGSVTQNTRVSYPINHIQNIVLGNAFWP